MNILSLFDGISCGKVALDRVGVKVDKYFASEIDKHAIKVSEDNHTNIIRIGDVTKVRYQDGVLFSEHGQWEVNIDLLLGGSPCQDFSSARAMGNNGMTPLGLDGSKSGLFYHYLRIKGEIEKENPDLIWLLENVKMKKESKQQLDNYLSTMGVPINSSLVSYQSRPRIYWSNLKFDVPEDKNISFQDYKEQGDLSVYKVNATPSRLRMWNGGNGNNSASSCANVTHAKKVQCLLTTKQDRSPNSGLVEYEDFCRYLTRSELEQAQTLPIGYTKAVSYNQAQAVLGNGWTVDVIAHILSSIND